MDTPRRYHSPVREAEAARTRALIVDAAAILFARDGYAATSLKAIAAEAGVSVQSVHLAGPKSALMLAAFERTFAGDEGRHSLTERPALAAILAEPDLDVALRAYVDFLTEANERAAPVWAAFRAAADADPAVRVHYVDIEQRRMRDMQLGAGWAISRGLVPESGARHAADVLGLITGPDTYLHFVGSCGWSLGSYRAWVARSIRVLLAPED